MTTHTGRCFFGAVHVEAEGAPLNVNLCHCHSCRKQTSSPVSGYADFRTAQLRWSGMAPRIYASSPGVRRGFCGTCGSPLFYESDGCPGETHLHLGILDDVADLVPTEQVFVEEKLPWLHVEAKQPG